MAFLKIHRGTGVESYPFEPPASLSDLLNTAGLPVDRPCGGRGVCGKCLADVEGEVSPLNEAERKAGGHLICQTTLYGDADFFADRSARRDLSEIETSSLSYRGPLDPMPGSFGFAVDIGTTTVVVQLYDLSTGACLSESSERNDQITVAADVMGRIEHALKGELGNLNSQILSQVRRLMDDCLAKAKLSDADAPSAVLTGNTTMLYLLTGRDPEPLSHAPFDADCLFGTEAELFGKTVYLPPCMSAFVGADIACAVLSSSMCSLKETSLLCDVGTNGEMALWLNGSLYVCSTAAGPAFEGAGISCGCSNIPGAVDRVTVENGKITAHTIGDKAAAGVCGSGLIDAVACMLETGELDETGYLEDDFNLSGSVYLSPADIRAVQLAKAAIAGGMQTLLESAETDVTDLKKLYLAGGFGNHMNVRSAARIGLIPDGIQELSVPIGNAALSGAVMLLLNQGLRDEIASIAKNAKTIALGGNPRFNQNYVEHMMFPET